MENAGCYTTAPIQGLLHMSRPTRRHLPPKMALTLITFQYTRECSRGSQRSSSVQLRGCDLQNGDHMPFVNE